MDKLYLRVEPHGGASFRHTSEGDEVILGRSSKAHVAIADPFLSRQHARLFRNGADWYVEDLGGKNRTVLNGRVVESAQPVKPGDVLTLSSTRVVLETEDGAAAPAAFSDSPVGPDVTMFRPVSSVLEGKAGDAPATDASGLRRHTERLRVLNEFHRALARPISLPDLLELVLDRAFADLRPEEAVLFLARPDGELEQAARRKLPGAPGEFLFSRSLAREVTQKGLAALVTDARSDQRFAAAESIVASGVHSLVAAPLQDAEKCLGMLVLSSRALVRSFDEGDLEELVFLASAAALRLRNLALAEEAAQRRLLEKELELARRIQVALLPEHLPVLPDFELCAFNVPTRRVSGDLYVVQTRKDDSECVVMLADVAGKGMSAALLTASLEALVAGPIEVGHPADTICTKLSRRLHARTSGERYATAFVFVLHLADGRVCWANAGHNPAVVVRRDGRVEELKATGLPLGLLPIGDYTRDELRLEPGDVLAAYTDGITEAANPEGDEFGLERLVAVCQEHSAQGADAIAKAVHGSLDAFTRGVPFGDDRTLVLLRRRAG